MRVATIGVFDGVHRGHQALVGRARELAGPEGTVVAVTFDPHPLSVLRPDVAPPMLTTIERRMELLHRAGADEVVVLPFSAELSERTPEEFIRYLVTPTGLEAGAAEGIDADAVVAGANFRFGKGAAGDAGTLREAADRMGFHADVLPLIADDVPDGAVTWSSTHVRQQLAEGQVDGAAHVLARPHRVEGLVVHGDKRGRELGYPTANVEPPAGFAIPADGVYAGWLADADTGTTYPAAISVGTNPHFAGTQRRVEAHVPGRSDLELYGHRVGVDFLQRLRGQLVFESLDGLLEQMGRDTQATLRLVAQRAGED